LTLPGLVTCEKPINELHNRKTKRIFLMVVKLNDVFKKKASAN
jgi:hypothetical protein